MSEWTEQCAEALSADGLLARGLQGFAFRESQQALSREIAQAIEDRAVLIAEAGTGTGKTYAYLVPALLSGKRVIISTGTKALQDQLYHRDLPRIKQALSTPVHSALLKGRANYLCLFRMDQAKSETFASPPVPVQKAPPAHGLRVGLAVFHNKFGEGKVLALEGTGDDARAQVNFPRHGTKWLALSVAKLTVVE